MRELSLLERRRAQAEVAVPLLREFERELGPERTREIAARAITDLARTDGRSFSDASSATDSVDRVRELVPAFARDDALEIDVREDSDDAYGFDVTRCRFAEIYRSMDAADWGVVLSCGRDFALTESLGDDIELERTQTLMEGAPCCDFRFRRRRVQPSADESRVPRSVASATDGSAAEPARPPDEPEEESPP